MKRNFKPKKVKLNVEKGTIPRAKKKKITLFEVEYLNKLSQSIKFKKKCDKRRFTTGSDGGST